MYKKLGFAALTIVMAASLAACGGKEAAPSTTSPNSTSTPAAANDNKPRTVQYLGKEYTVPAKAEKIVITGSVESMEDALILDVKPTGAMTSGGKFSPLFTKITAQSEKIGEKIQPNIETILKLKPDVILASTKFPAEMIDKLNKVATTIPVSHISTNWDANLNLLAELTGKQEDAKKLLQKYQDEIKSLKEKIGPVIKDKKVLVLRVRTGSTFIYPQDVFFNTSIYGDLGATVPEEVKQAKAQQLVSIEKLSEMNPDYIFVQFLEDENKDKPKSLEDLQNNPIWKSINAVKNGNVFVNIVDPELQGGTAHSKMTFLEAIKNSKLVQK
ncbi:ABC transporter substrate-binding protein [Paenibacillus sp. N1-5-1-14]|uniref:ABC transporter substrate-binding protein n=1 Tax=Paenibacillus radicibacter TaxID=2972488 RepID=UPI0021599B83|nr:ABC transporter substrate-binding protein [Paenibacillus radicibacter]MCR8641649.1 ABC transporter substrate-binding protein [Paenibacillus radicibacter]